MDNILEAHNITKTFTGVTALNDVSIDVPRGAIYGLLGPNGAGKTTLIRIINHITTPDSGTVTIDGQPVTSESVRQIGYLPEERGLYKKMRVAEQAVFFARLRGMDSRQAEAEFADWAKRLGMDGWEKKKVSELSKGMAQKVQFVTTVMHRPKLLILDEPFSGFDPINAELLKNEVLRLRNQGTTIILSSHNMDNVEELCDSITLINKSHNILTGRVDDIRRSYGANRYTLVFNGDSEALRTAIEDKVTTLEFNSEGDQFRADITLTAESSRRDILDAANQVVDIASFAPMLPSLNNIFVQAVTDFNKANPS